MKDRCDKECFANKDGRCLALTEIPKECRFRRTDIKMERQEKDIREYNSRSSLGYGRIK